MSADPSVSLSAVVCGACSVSNHPNAQFCSGCGQPLYEPCSDCSKPVSLTQSFCGSCGMDLTKAVKKARAKYEGWLVDAIGMAKQDDFDEAVGMLGRIARVDDFRYRDLAKNAGEAIEKIKKICDQRTAQARAAMKLAQEPIQAEDHRRVVEILGKAPLKLISEEARQALRHSEGFLSSQGSLTTDIRKAIEQRDWHLSGPLLNQLIELEPDNKEYGSLAEQVAKRLVVLAKADFHDRKYAAALRSLDGVPTSCQDEAYQQLRGKIQDIVWLRNQFDDEPFDTPTLGRLAARLQKIEPDDPRNEQRVKLIAKNLREGKRKPRTQYPPRAGHPQSWLGCDLGHLTALTCLKRPDLADLRPKWGAMNVAFGLALQGIGEGRIQSQMMPKKGLLKRLTGKKSNIAYGMDIGSFAIKVVGLEKREIAKNEFEIHMTDGFVHTFENPHCRPGYDEDPLAGAAEAIEQIMQEHDFGEAPVWINMPATEQITRFTLLPPVADKQAKQLMETEVNERIPFDLEDLWVDKWIAPFDNESTMGRPAVISAVKQVSIEQRLERLALTDLNIAGMQSDPLALVNLLSVEFAEDLEEELDDEEKTPTIVLVDAGAESTSLILVSKTLIGSGRWNMAEKT